MASPIRIGLVGVGKIARDQHLPVLAASPDYALVAVASPHGGLDGVPSYATLEAMLAAHGDLDAVALCQPPQARFAAALAGIAAGRHVFLEKPPGATLAEVGLLVAAARDRGVSLFASWHSRYAPGVEPARRWLSGRRIRSVAIAWLEDVRHWHPGQDWIWDAGGMGVFDPGINALSIATHILPPFFLTGATLSVPANRQAPIAADLHFADAAGTPIRARFDWRQTGPQTWDIRVETDDGPLVLSRGGAALSIAGRDRPLPPEAEYRGLYDRFAALVRSGASDVDLNPLIHAADAFMRGERRTVEAFTD
ncbi:Gfo/Idh/MocA family protein [Methylobacterium radiotolerans]|jgi:D-galactose 1-dehydrogenase|uniref:Gfo/Idh/MocA family protein n=1 Tax=Methylobacterium TaxID=407 RepID=UPI0005DCE1CE|nr:MULTISPECIES: Gfo/Idh/MocA family oxidoreductase [Methylobacterium]GAN50877.1 galactose 1-dehydrogenase [Methylobacterium sp. ME121]MBN6820365.1 Gfo/Idh/MocA family oxidoreductase [Methylobacterium organophilum]MDE3746464.1 Gfo/Idh/MocA family oxidoreductase [Methylobacterium radiotolerans]ONF47277.1 galactose 1-dehydrogenase [Methylobacterium radiotolerans]OXE38417.1 gfo/Idh/MocA family oxidoreductase [Methylobacterium radiotolerans]